MSKNRFDLSAQPEILTTFTGTYAIDSQQLPIRTERIATSTAEKSKLPGK